MRSGTYDVARGRSSDPPRAAVLLGIVASFYSQGCASVLGFEDPIPLADSGGDGSLDAAFEAEVDSGSIAADSSPDVSTDSPAWDASGPDGAGVSDSADASTYEGGREAGVDRAPCSAATVDLTQIFVAQFGSGSDACGAASAPCASIQTGIDRAYALGKSAVFIAEGTYAEQVSLRAGITLVGGFHATGTTWTKDTSNNAASLVVIQPVGATRTILADSIGGAAQVCTLTLRSKSSALVNAGESLYGVFARGASTTLALDNVSVSVTRAGDGTSPPPPPVGAPGAQGGCAVPGNGQSATVAGAPGAPGGPGVFSIDGYLAQSGGPGAPGASGANGPAGGMGTCVTCVTCSAYPACKSRNMGQSCGALGLGGCGGNGGPGGFGGGGGGSSIGVYVWEANVTIANSALTAGSGGAGAFGSSGGAGGGGAAGGVGAAGTQCGSGSCSRNATTLSCDTSGTIQGPGGSKGGQGGAGSAGGPGGGGGGGASCAIASGGGGVVTAPNLTNSFVFGGAGTGAGGAPSGAAAMLCF